MPGFTRTSRIGALAGMFAMSGLLCLWLIGCSKSSSEPIVIVIDPPTWLELNGHGAGTVTSYPDGTMREKRIPYRDGSVGVQSYRTDGTLEKTIVYWAPEKPGISDEKIKSIGNWSLDGKEMTDGKLYRPDGSIALHRKQSKSTRTTDYFRPDGFRHVQTMLPLDAERNPGNLHTVRYYHPSAGLWCEEVWQSDENEDQSILSEKFFDTYTGKAIWSTHHFVKEEENDQGEVVEITMMRVAFFDDEGNASHRQLWELGEQYSEYDDPECHECGGEIPDKLLEVEILAKSSDTNSTEHIAAIKEADFVKRYFMEDKGSEIHLRKALVKESGSGNKNGTAWTERIYDGERDMAIVIENAARGERKLVCKSLSCIESDSGEISPLEDESTFDKVEPKVFITPEYPSELLKLIESADIAVTPDHYGPRDVSDPCRWFFQR